MKLISLGSIYLLGLLVLGSAILVNLLASYFKLVSWYQFFQVLASQGLDQALVALSLFDFFFLLVFYPLLLGLIAYFSFKLVV